MASNASSLYDQMVMKIGASFEAEETVDDDDDDGTFGSASTLQVSILSKMRGFCPNTIKLSVPTCFETASLKCKSTAHWW